MREFSAMDFSFRKLATLKSESVKHAGINYTETLESGSNYYLDII